MAGFELEIRQLAAFETIDAFDYYEQQREGLGNEFLTDLDNFYDAILSNPHTHSYYQKPIRQGNLSRFPYVVVYEVYEKVIVVFSVFMTMQDPAKKRTV